MDQLRRFYRYGVGREPDRAVSDKWAKCYLEAKLHDGGDASRGNAGACVSVGNYYLWGCGVQRDPAQAAAWYEKAAERKSWSAMLTLFWMFLDGACGEPDSEKAEQWIRKALNELTPLAENGLASAQRALADCYARGWGVEPSAELAVKWYSEASAGGDWLAAARLARYYASGEGVPRDDAKALELLNRAAIRYSGEAQNRLGESYENAASGLACDCHRAFELYRQAASEENAGGLYNVGRCYAFGIGCEKDLGKAVMWLELAAVQLDNFDKYGRKAADLLKNLEKPEN